VLVTSSSAGSPAARSSRSVLATSAMPATAARPSRRRRTSTSRGRTPHASSSSVSPSSVALGPCARTLPADSNTRRSAASAARISCSTMTTATPAARRVCSSASTARLPSGSMSVVGSSSRITRGSSARIPASARRCFSPPDNVAGSRAAKPARPTRASAASVRARMVARGSPSCCGAKPTSRVTLVENSWASKSWNTMPTRPARSPGRSPSIVALKAMRVPLTSARSKPGTIPVKHLSRVDLPAPLWPITATISPAATSKSTSRSAGVVLSA